MTRYEPELGPTEEPTVWMSECEKGAYILYADHVAHRSALEKERDEYKRLYEQACSSSEDGYR